MPACLQTIELLESHMPSIDSLDNADITVRLHLHKLQFLVINELMTYLGKFSDSGSAANIEAIERLREHKNIIKDVIDMIEKSAKPVTVN
jgi:hypothetical protein